MFKRVAGTKDILPQETLQWQTIEDLARQVFSLYAYQEIRTPVLEDAGLYNRSLGEFTEIVQKQMFLVNNKEDTYALRPEGTASIVRAYIENSLDKTASLSRLYYIGPMFRLERPQKGRLRQFHHIGAEVIGSGEPQVDIEVISLCVSLLKAWGVSGYELLLNSLGCVQDRKRLMRQLSDALRSRSRELCDDCKVRVEKNVLRVLDCKQEACRRIVSGLHIGSSHLCGDCAAHFSSVCQGLKKLGIEFSVEPLLVRGLDYYTRTVFEIKHKGLGAQDALGAGGRYDNLCAELSGPQTGAMGFAFGVERLLLIATPHVHKQEKPLVFVIGLGEEAAQEKLLVLDELRTHNIPATTNLEEKSLKGSMRQANDMKARFVAIIGENELKNKVVTLKDMSSGEQKELSLPDLIRTVSI